ncbi:hypothetical protein [Marinobacter flavimaris]|uniref:hypothetical protein n=1 Tax=Marinobacter flavimaris TaxID=262076 RepID=UPI0038663DFE
MDGLQEEPCLEVLGVWRNQANSSQGHEMLNSRKLRKLAPVLLKPSIITGRSEYLFIISHMRSRSTVLSHVLGSNPGVCGYSELHRSYRNKTDFLKMRVNLYHDLKCDFSNKYILDKILHNRLEISPEMLEAMKPRVIFLLREPESTIKSIIRMRDRVGQKNKQSDAGWHDKARSAAEYYCSRLVELSRYADALNGNYFFLESDDLVDKTDQILNELTDWLKLKQPLANNYEMFENTGKPDYGDPSEAIKTGAITRTESNSKIEIPGDIRHEVNLAYEKCRLGLANN